MARHLYVYYRVSESEAVTLRPRIVALMQAMAPHCAKHALLHRASSAETQQTWLEVYERIDDEFEPLLTEQIVRFGLTALQRRHELFHDWPAAFDRVT